MIESLGLKHMESVDRAKEFLLDILEGDHLDESVCAFLGELRNLPLSEQLITGFRNAMMERAVPVDIGNIPAIDICGTGGDGKNTFNISTLAALTIASCGFPVVKHGNSAFSSACGSSDILKRCGIKIPSRPDQVLPQLERCGISFLHAPFYHPSLKRIGASRKKVQFRTIFNILGPLCNPARPAVKVLGVSHFALSRVYRAVLSREPGAYAVMWDEGGYDEITLTDRAFVTLNGREHILGANDFGTERVRAECLLGPEGPEEGTALFVGIASGRGTAEQTAVVAANAAIGIHLAEPSRELRAAFETAVEALRSGVVARTVEKLREEIQ